VKLSAAAATGVPQSSSPPEWSEPLLGCEVESSPELAWDELAGGAGAGIEEAGEGAGADGVEVVDGATGAGGGVCCTRA
jgi:hypothetical protein